MKKTITKKQLKDFSLVLGIGFPFFIGWLIPFISSHPFKLWTIWIGIISLMIGAVAPHFLKFPYKLWMRIGHVLGWINSRIILGLVFIIILQPIALIMRAKGYDPLRKKKGNMSSYRELNKEDSVDYSRIF